MDNQQTETSYMSEEQLRQALTGNKQGEVEFSPIDGEELSRVVVTMTCPPP